MKRLPNKLRRKAERGAIILFLVIAIALLSLSIHRFLPAIEPSYPRNKKLTTEELNELAFGMREYYFDQKGFPTAITGASSSAFSQKFFNLGLMAETTNYTGSAVRSQWPKISSGTATWTLLESITNGTGTDSATFGSAGPDFQDDSFADDDVYRTVSPTVVATARTRRLLALIRQAVTYYSVNLTISAGSWQGSTGKRGNGTSCTPTGGCSLGPEFDRDGWGQYFIVRAASSVVFSCGPNEVSNAGGSDDITW